MQISQSNSYASLYKCVCPVLIQFQMTHDPYIYDYKLNTYNLDPCIPQYIWPSNSF
jgi:hypothetical protein